MYLPDRRRGRAGPCARQAPAEAHHGPASEYLRRHEEESRRATRPGKKRRELLSRLLDRVADPRNLYLAWQHLARFGGQAPGLDGLRPGGLTGQEAWAWARAAGRAIRTGQYRPGPERQVDIPKPGGRGRRTLTLQSVLDRAVQRAAAQ